MQAVRHRQCTLQQKRGNWKCSNVNCEYHYTADSWSGWPLQCVCRLFTGFKAKQNQLYSRFQLRWEITRWIAWTFTEVPKIAHSAHAIKLSASTLFKTGWCVKGLHELSCDLCYFCESQRNVRFLNATEIHCIYIYSAQLYSWGGSCSCVHFFSILTSWFPKALPDISFIPRLYSELYRRIVILSILKFEGLKMAVTDWIQIRSLPQTEIGEKWLCEFGYKMIGSLEGTFIADLLLVLRHS